VLGEQPRYQLTSRPGIALAQHRLDVVAHGVCGQVQFSCDFTGRQAACQISTMAISRAVRP